MGFRVFNAVIYTISFLCMLFALCISNWPISLNYILHTASCFILSVVWIWLSISAYKKKDIQKAGNRGKNANDTSGQKGNID